MQFAANALRWLRGAGSSNPSLRQRNSALPGVLDAHDTNVAYPPVDLGIPFKSVEEILAGHEDLLRRLKLSYGSDQATFDKHLFALVRRYAAYVHLMPATPDNFFCGPGGLLRMGLETAFFALQATDGHIFSGRETISRRRNMEPKWRYATFLAGLCSEAHRTLSKLIVTDEQGNEWPCYLKPLAHWLTEQRRTRFFVRWVSNAQESRSLGVFALPHIIPDETLQFLAEGNSVVVPHMMACISGMPVYREQNVLEQLVRRATALVIDRDLQVSAHRYGKPQLGAHLERYLIDAMRRLVACNSAWKPNDAKSRVWYGADGLFLVWPNSATEICALLEADRLPGVPKSPETILEILVDAGIIEPQSSATIQWPIYLPGADRAVEAIKLSSPSVLLVQLDRPPEPLSAGLTKPPELRSDRAAPVPSAPEPRGQLNLLVVNEAPAGPPKEATANNTPPVESQTREIEPEKNEPSVAEIPSRPRFSLSAPARLNPTVRAALTEIVATLNAGGAEAAACSVPDGLFVPLAQLERRRLDTGLALRALADTSMLVLPAKGASKTHMKDFGGTPMLGIVIAAKFVVGFDPECFTLPPPEGAHASPQV